MSYTEADIQLVAGIWRDRDPDTAREDARQVLDALAAAGRLRTPGDVGLAEKLDGVCAILTATQRERDRLRAELDEAHAAGRLLPPDRFRQTFTDGMWCTFHAELDGPCNCPERTAVTVTQIVARRVVEP